MVTGEEIGSILMYHHSDRKRELKFSCKEHRLQTEICKLYREGTQTKSVSFPGMAYARDQLKISVNKPTKLVGVSLGCVKNLNMLTSGGIFANIRIEIPSPGRHDICYSRIHQYQVESFPRDMARIVFDKHVDLKVSQTYIISSHICHARSRYVSGNRVRCQVVSPILEPLTMSFWEKGNTSALVGDTTIRIEPNVEDGHLFELLLTK